MDLITCWASVPERGRLPSPGITTLTAQPKAYAAEDKLQGKRQVARGKEKCEQREGDEVTGMCGRREEGAAAKAASREEGVTLHDLNTSNNMEYPGAPALASAQLQAPGDKGVEATLCCVHLGG